MRRIAIWLASTVTIVVLLFGYHTSTNQTTQTVGSSGFGGATSSGPAGSGTTGSGTTNSGSTSSGSTNSGSSGAAGSPPDDSGHRHNRGDDDSGESDDGPVIGGNSAGSGSGTNSGTNSGSSSTGNSGSSAGSNSGGSSSSNAGAKTYTGAVAQTQWGPVQVQISVQSGKVTNVNLLQYPNGNGHDAQINSYALPILVQETISKQSANIDMVGGATVTSTGYVQSLQSALDQAGI